MPPAGATGANLPLDKFRAAKYGAGMDHLQVFVSWSGERSLAIAKLLKAWLPDVVRNAELWISNEDLRKGLQWLPELNKNLATTGFGLSILTSENRTAPWLIFEAGVISKALSDKHCCPLLCDLKQSDVSGPLAQFQSTLISDKEDMYRLAGTMNDASGTSKVDDDRLRKWFDQSWGDFSKEVQAILVSSPHANKKASPSERELLEEILQTTRRLAIEPRNRSDDIRAWESRLIMSPEAVLSQFARLAPRDQVMLVETLSDLSPDGLRHFMRRAYRNRPPSSIIGVDPTVVATNAASTSGKALVSPGSVGGTATPPVPSGEQATAPRPEVG